MARSDQGGRNRLRNGTCGCFAIVAGIVIIWFIVGQQPPPIVVPTPTMPSPNGFDTFLLAANQYQDSTPIGYAIGTKHSGRGPDRDYTLAEKEKFVSENAQTIALIQKGNSQAYLNPPARSFRTVFPYFASFRGMARLLLLKAQLQAQKGDYAGAVDTELDILQMGSQAPKGGVIIAGLVGIAIESIGRRPMWDDYKHLTPAQARRAIGRLEQIRKGETPFADTMQEEKWAGQAGLLEVFRQPGSARDLLTSLNNTNNGSAGPNIPPAAASAMSGLFYMVYSKRRIMNDYTDYMEKEAARAAKPYGAKLPQTPVPNDPIVQLLSPVFSTAHHKYVERDTRNGLIETALALRAYHAEHGVYPDTLAQLSPAYLPAPIVDPYSLGKPFGYRKAGTDFVLYSIGPDGKDDGGRPIDKPVPGSLNPHQRYAVQPDSVGDIVVGTNNW